MGVNVSAKLKIAPTAIKNKGTVANFSLKSDFTKRESVNRRDHADKRPALMMRMAPPRVHSAAAPAAAITRLKSPKPTIVEKRTNSIAESSSVKQRATGQA